MLAQNAHPDPRTPEAGRCPVLPRLTHPIGRPYHLPAPDRVICGMALPVAPT
jgi:hypothetical protein